MSKNYANKGYEAEEAFRHYFLELGYYTVRGVPFNYKSYEITDIDLWLYIKTSTISRERAVVDIKRRKTPQAIERVFWTKGLKEVLRVEQGIVVTSDNRIETREFGAMNGITVLHGEFLQRVLDRYTAIDRLSEEEFYEAIGQSPCLSDSKITWARWYRQTKVSLVEGLNFDTGNILLAKIKMLMDEYIATGKTSTSLVRLLYIVISYFLISLDYSLRSIAYIEPDARKHLITNGIRYGEAGKENTEKIISVALRFLSSSRSIAFPTKIDIQSEIQQQVLDYPAEIIGEYFSKQEPLKNIFELARYFENQAFTRNILLPSQCINGSKSLIGLLCDFIGIDRKEVL